MNQKIPKLKKLLPYLVVSVALGAITIALLSLVNTLFKLPKTSTMTATIQELVVGSTGITFDPAVVSYLSHETTYLNMHPKVYELQLKLDGGWPKGTTQIVRLNPEFTHSHQRVYVTDSMGKPWDLYHSGIIFHWQTTKINLHYQVLLRNPARYSLIKFRPLSGQEINETIPAPQVNTTCSHEHEREIPVQRICWSIFMHYLTFVIPIEVLEIRDDSPAIKPEH